MSPQRIALLVVFGLLAAVATACSKVASQPQEIICVASTKEMCAAVVAVDGKPVGALDYLVLHGTWFDRVLKVLFPNSLSHDAVALNIVLSPGELTEGTHELSVSKPGYLPHIEAFSYPLPNAEKPLHVVVVPRPLAVHRATPE